MRTWVLLSAHFSQQIDNFTQEIRIAIHNNKMDQIQGDRIEVVEKSYFDQLQIDRDHCKQQADWNDQGMRERDHTIMNLEQEIENYQRAVKDLLRYEFHSCPNLSPTPVEQCMFCKALEYADELISSTTTAEPKGIK